VTVPTSAMEESVLRTNKTSNLEIILSFHLSLPGAAGQCSSNASSNGPGNMAPIRCEFLRIPRFDLISARWLPGNKIKNPRGEYEKIPVPALPPVQSNSLTLPLGANRLCERSSKVRSPCMKLGSSYPRLRQVEAASGGFGVFASLSPSDLRNPPR